MGKKLSEKLGSITTPHGPLSIGLADEAATLEARVLELGRDLERSEAQASAFYDRVQELEGAQDRCEATHMHFSRLCDACRTRFDHAQALQSHPEVDDE